MSSSRSPLSTSQSSPVRLTDEGEARHAAAQADIRTMEAELLGDLSATERRCLLAVLPRLAEPRVP